MHGINTTTSLEDSLQFFFCKHSFYDNDTILTPFNSTPINCFCWKLQQWQLRRKGCVFWHIIRIFHKKKYYYIFFVTIYWKFAVFFTIFWNHENVYFIFSCEVTLFFDLFKHISMALVRGRRKKPSNFHMVLRLPIWTTNKLNFSWIYTLAYFIAGKIQFNRESEIRSRN